MNWFPCCCDPPPKCFMCTDYMPPNQQFKLTIENFGIYTCLFTSFDQCVYRNTADFTSINGEYIYQLSPTIRCRADLQSTTATTDGTKICDGYFLMTGQTPPVEDCDRHGGLPHFPPNCANWLNLINWQSYCIKIPTRTEFVEPAHPWYCSPRPDIYGCGWFGLQIREVVIPHSCTTFRYEMGDHTATQHEQWKVFATGDGIRSTCRGPFMCVAPYPSFQGSFGTCNFNKETGQTESCEFGTNGGERIVFEAVQ